MLADFEFQGHDSNRWDLVNLVNFTLSSTCWLSFDYLIAYIFQVNFQAAAVRHFDYVSHVLVTLKLKVSIFKVQIFFVVRILRIVISVPLVYQENIPVEYIVEYIMFGLHCSPLDQIFHMFKIRQFFKLE